MSFPSSPGYEQLQGGYAFPVKYAKDLLLYFRTLSVTEEVTNTDYEREIKDFGDTVKIIKEPVITTRAYTRGNANLTFQAIEDTGLDLVVDQAEYFAFKVDDIEDRQSHIDWLAKATASGAYQLRKTYDTNVLAYMVSNASTNSGTGTAGSPKTVGYGSLNDFTPLDYMARCARLLDENDVPDDQRYFVAKPVFWEQVAREDSSLVDVSITGDAESVIRNKKLATSRMIHGFMCFKSNNLGVDSSSNNVGVFGHRSAVSTANNLVKQESFRLTTEGFGTGVKSLLVWGRKVIRPEGLFCGSITIGDLS